MKHLKDIHWWWLGAQATAWQLSPTLTIIGWIVGIFEWYLLFTGQFLLMFISFISWTIISACAGFFYFHRSKRHV